MKSLSNIKIENNDIYFDVLELHGITPVRITEEYFYYGDKDCIYVPLDKLNEYISIDEYIKEYINYRYIVTSTGVKELAKKYNSNNFNNSDRGLCGHLVNELIRMRDGLGFKYKLMYEIDHPPELTKVLKKINPEDKYHITDKLSNMSIDRGVGTSILLDIDWDIKYYINPKDELDDPNELKSKITNYE